MNETDYKPNSHKFKEDQQNGPVEKKRVEKIVKGRVKTKKKSEVSKFVNNFISEDTKDLKSWMVMDILIPSIKNTISEMVRTGIDIILFGEGGRRGKSSNASYVSYRSYSDRRDDSRRSIDAGRVRSGYSYDDIILESRGEAEDVLARMDEIIEEYGMVSVADLYDLVGKPCNYTDNKYGWKNIRNAEASRVRDGYMLKLPKASLL